MLITSCAKGRFLIRSKKHPKQVDDDDNDVLETPTEDTIYTNAAMKEGEDAILRADAVVRGEKTKTNAESKNGGDNDDSNSTAGKAKTNEGGDGKWDSDKKTNAFATDGVISVVWEELHDERMIQGIVGRCVEDIYKLFDDRKRETAQKKKIAKEKRNCLHQLKQQRIATALQQEEEEEVERKREEQMQLLLQQQ